jgi:hypothetical protein
VHNTSTTVYNDAATTTVNNDVVSTVYNHADTLANDIATPRKDIGTVQSDHAAPSNAGLPGTPGAGAVVSAAQAAIPRLSPRPTRTSTTETGIFPRHTQSPVRWAPGHVRATDPQTRLPA